MGIADRDYTSARFGRGRAFGLAGLTVTMWLIIINVAIFLVNGAVLKYGSPVLIRTELQPGVQAYVRSKTYYPLSGADLTSDPRSSPTASSAEQHRVSNMLYRVAYSPKTGEIVGREYYRVEPLLYAWGHFSTYTGFRQLEVWRLVTFQFLHASVPHVALNMFSLFMFAPVVEEHLGRRKFLAFYLVCGIFGGLMYLLLNVLGIVLPAGFPKIPGLLFHETTTPLVGASAGCFGVIMACAFIAPQTEVVLPFPPIALRMRTLAYGYFVISLVSLFIGTKNAGGEAAHVGGALAGYYFIRNSHMLRDFFDVFTDSRRSLPMRNRGGSAGRGGAGAKGLKLVQPPTRDEERMDALLAKVKSSGLDSLTSSEREFLRKETERRQKADGKGPAA